MSKIEGPLGLWPFPLINGIIEIANDDTSNKSTNDSASMKEINVQRNENGKIESIDIVGVDTDE